MTRPTYDDITAQLAKVNLSHQKASTAQIKGDESPSRLAWLWELHQAQLTRLYSLIREATAPDDTLTSIVQVLQERAAMWSRTEENATAEGDTATAAEARASASECRFLLLELAHPTTAGAAR